MGLDPLKLKEERDSFERENKILRTERDALMADVQAKDSLLAVKDAELKALILTNEQRNGERATGDHADNNDVDGANHNEQDGVNDDEADNNGDFVVLSGHNQEVYEVDNLDQLHTIVINLENNEDIFTLPHSQQRVQV